MNFVEQYRAAVAELMSAIWEVDHLEDLMESMGVEDSDKMSAAYELVGIAALNAYYARQAVGADAPSLDKMIARLEGGGETQAVSISAVSPPWRR